MLTDPDLVMEFLEVLRGIRRYRRWCQRKAMPLRHNEMMLLMFLNHHLERNPVGIQPSELGEILHMTRPAVTSLVNSLEEQQCVERINAEEDRRVVFVRPTAKGVSLVKRLGDELAADIGDVLTELGEEDTKELLRILDRIRTVLENRQEDGGN